MATYREYAKQVADTIIDQLRRGVAPWTKPWAPGTERFLPHNGLSGRDYHGGNVLWLLATAEQRGYSDSRWYTLRQANLVAAKVRKGEHGTIVKYWAFEGNELVRGPDGTVQRDDKGELVRTRVRYERPRVTTSCVFNAEQLDGLPPREHLTVLPEWERHERAEGILRESGANVRHISGDSASYNVREDTITLPEQAQFASADLYYSTLFHEFAHWTGHPDRLDRDLNHPFGSDEYAREELRAEIASLMLGADLSVGHDPSRHASYVKFWIRQLEEDPLELFRAAASAQKITTFIQEFDRRRERRVDNDADAIDTLQRLESPANEKPVLVSPGVPMDEDRILLAIPYAEKDAAKAIAKAAGVRITFDKKAHAWYLPKDADTAPFAKWLRASTTIAPDRVFLDVPYSDREALKAVAKSSGVWITFDKKAHAWYLPKDADTAPFAKWLPKPAASRTIVDDPYVEFSAALQAAGLVLDDRPLMDGKLHRVPVEGDARGERSGAYIGHLDGYPAGHIQNFKTGFKENWKSSVPVDSVSPEERKRLLAEAEQRLTEREIERERQYRAAAKQAEERWAEALPLSNHPYLESKHVRVYGELRGDDKGNLLVPITDSEGHLQSLQSIAPDGKKSFEKRARVSGGMFVLAPHESGPSENAVAGDLEGIPSTIFVAEGYATAASVARATGCSTVVAFNAGNLEAVARHVHATRPEVLVCVAGDNDHIKEAAGKANVGREKAVAAAKAVDGIAVIPPFSPEQAGSDWNDFERLAGDDGGLKLRSEIRIQVSKALLERKQSVEQQQQRSVELPEQERTHQRKVDTRVQHAHRLQHDR